MLAAAVLAGCGSSDSSAKGSNGQKLTTINFAGPTAPNGIVSQIAYGKYEGFFAKHGIDLEISYPSNSGGASVIDLVANGRYQLVEGTPTAMLGDYASGVKTLGIFGFLEKNASGISVPKDRGATTPEQLKGLTIGVATGSDTINVLPAYLAHFGLKPSDVKIQQLSLSALPTALKSRSIDAIAAYPYAFDPQLRGLGLDPVDFLFTDAGINTIQAVFAVSADWAKQNPDVVKELGAALRESTDAAIKDPAKAAADLVKSAPGTAPPVDIVQQQWEATEPYFTTENSKGQPLGYMAPKDWEDTVAYGAQYLGRQKIDPTPVYTNQYVPGVK